MERSFKDTRVCQLLPLGDEEEDEDLGGCQGGKFLCGAERCLPFPSAYDFIVAGTYLLSLKKVIKDNVKRMSKIIKENVKREDILYMGWEEEEYKHWQMLWR